MVLLVYFSVIIYGIPFYGISVVAIINLIKKKKLFLCFVGEFMEKIGAFVLNFL
jgi:hypothetical protein